MMYDESHSPPRGSVPQRGAANRVEDDAYFDAGLRTRDHRLDEHVRSFARLEDVGLEVDRHLGGEYGVAHCRIELRAVGEDVDAIVAVNGSLAGRLQHVDELAAVRAQRNSDVVIDPRREQQNEGEPGYERQADELPPVHDVNGRVMQNAGCKMQHGNRSRRSAVFVKFAF